MQNIFTKRIRNRTVSAVLGIMAVTSCATISGTIPSSEQLAAGESVATGTDMEALARGRALAVTECASCHRLYRSHEYSPEEWPAIIRKMGYRASLSEEQINDLKLYLVSASSAARNAKEAGSYRQEKPGKERGAE